MDPCLVQVGDVGIVVLHNGTDEILLRRQILAIVMVPPDNHSTREAGQALEEVVGDFIARGIQHIFVMEDVPRDNDERSLCLDSFMSTECVKEGIEDTPVFFFSRPLSISRPNMDIGYVEDVTNGHFEDVYEYPVKSNLG